MCFFAFSPCNDPSCSCPQTSRTTRGPVERKCAVLNHFPDPMFSELEWSWRRRPAEMDHWLFQEQPDCKAGSVPGLACACQRALGFPGKAAPQVLRQGPHPAGSFSDSRGPLRCFQLSLCSVLCWKPTLQWDGNTSQYSALHLKNLWVKHSLKRRKTNPLFIFRGYNIIATSACRNNTPPPFHKIIEL